MTCKAPDSIDEVYAEVVEDFSEKRSDDMRKLMSILVRTTDEDAVAPDQNHKPIDPQDDKGSSVCGYLNPFTIAKFVNWKRFCSDFPTYVVDMMSHMITRAVEIELIDGNAGQRLNVLMENWIDRMGLIMKSINSNAIKSNCDFTKFCTQARITDLFQRGDIVFDNGTFDVDCIEGAMVAVELDMLVIDRLIKSPVANAMFGGDAIVSDDGIERVVKTPSIVDML